jgi:hypothetical protein
MADVLDWYRRHRDHCLVLAEAAPDDRTRASLFRIARQFEIESRLMISANLESRELLERISSVRSRMPPFKFL